MNISNSHLFVIFNKVHLGYNKKLTILNKIYIQAQGRT